VSPISPERSRPALRLVAAAEPRADAHAHPGAPRPPPAPLLDDSELLVALRAGDASAATAFHDRVRPQVNRTIRRLLGTNDPDEEDVAQRALIEIVSTIDRYRGDCSLDHWTNTLTAHVVYKEIRRRTAERRVFAGFEPEEVSVPSRHSDQDVVARSTVRRIRHHLEAMDEGKAWTVVLHDVCGYELREIAKIMSVGVAAAQTRLVRGRRELHERIAADPELVDRLEGRGGAS
jgi:RNA polymerase sigma-70 factor (ECF subfamily)